MIGIPRTSNRVLFYILFIPAVVLGACAPGTPTPTRSIRALIPTSSPRAPGVSDSASNWLFGTATPTLPATTTPTTGPSPTLTPTPTPVNATTLKGQLLFVSSRPLPPAYGSGGLGNLRSISPDLFRSLQGRSAATIWRFDPANYRVAPCDPPPATPTPLPPGVPTPALLFSDLNQILAQGASACARVYAEALAAQAWSPDQQYETFVGADPNGGRPQIWVLDHQGDLGHAGNTRKMVTVFGSGVSYDPAFAPDGYHIAFISQERSGVDNLYTVTRDGTDLRRVTRVPGQAWDTTWEWVKRPTWSSDGTQLAFWSNRVSGARQIWIMNADGSNLHTLSNDPRPAEDWDPVWIR